MEPRPKAPVQRIGDRLPHILIARVGHVSVDKQGILLLQDIQNRLLYLPRRRDARVSEAEIKHIFPAVKARQPVSLLEHHPDRGIVLNHRRHFF